MRKLATFIFSAATIAVTAPAAAQNLLADPGFEQTATPNADLLIIGGGQTFGGWTVTGGNVLLINTNYLESGPVPFTANSGLNSVDITGAGNQGSQNGLFQDVATSIGSLYDLTFFLGNVSGRSDYAGDAAVNVVIGGLGGTGTLFTNAAVTANEVNWAQRSLRFTATGAQTRITLLNASSTDNGVLIDDISLVAVPMSPGAVPEPATWAMMITGFGLVGGAMRRRGGGRLART